MQYDLEFSNWVCFTLALHANYPTAIYTACLNEPFWSKWIFAGLVILYKNLKFQNEI